MNKDIKAAMLQGNLILFLGAGASKNSTDQFKHPILDGYGLAQRLANEANLPFNDEPLDTVYSAARQKLQGRLTPILEQLFRHCSPSSEYIALARHAWRRIYSLNIDDSFDHALAQYSPQKIEIHTGLDPLKDRDQLFSRLDYVKLNGCISRLKEGLVFSATEYARATNSPMPWYVESAADFLRTPFLFIGTKLDEPLFKFHIERYKQINSSQPGASFVIVPSLSEIQRLDLLASNIEHISGTLSDFSAWIDKEFPKGIAPLDLAKASLPQLAEMINSKDQHRYASLFSAVTHVNRATLKTSPPVVAHTTILDFYKGFKPTWSDIVHRTPAELDALPQLLNFLQRKNESKTLVPLIGPAGSGKTTLLMQTAFQISQWKDTTVYFIDEPIKNLKAVLDALEAGASTTSVYVAIDKIDHMADQLLDVLKSGRLQKTTIIGAERQNIWHKRLKHAISEFSTTPFEIGEFTKTDAEKLLIRLEQFGSWTRLSKLPPEKRNYELVSRSQRQLLIAMLEATSGRGFEEIIENDYDSLTTEAERLYLILVGLATIHRVAMPVALASRALVQLSIAGHFSDLSPALSGIVVLRDGRLLGRHEIYVRYLLDKHVDPKLVEKAIDGLLRAFALNQAPVIQNIPKVDAAIYKATINHRFLHEVLGGKKALVLGLYKSLEKRFELDGLFWLQYGLSLRDFDEHSEALEKLRVAVHAYRMDHTEHALAQQLLITAEHGSSRAHIEAQLEEAREILLRLDKTVTESDDTYPIVTLAEGHTKVIKLLDGDQQARTFAGIYANQVKQRLDEHPDNERLRACWESLVRYASTGMWVDQE